MLAVSGGGLLKFNRHGRFVPIIHPKHVSQFVPEVRSLKFLVNNNRNRNSCDADRLLALIDIYRVLLLWLNHAGCLQFRQHSINKNVRFLLAVFLAAKYRLLYDVASNALHLVAPFVMSEELGIVNL